MCLFILFYLYYNSSFGDWGLGIGDWAQSPIPNPQSPFNSSLFYCLLITRKLNNYIKMLLI